MSGIPFLILSYSGVSKEPITFLSTIRITRYGNTIMTRPFLCSPYHLVHHSRKERREERYNTMGAGIIDMETDYKED